MTAPVAGPTHVLVLNGPNLGRLGRRQPEIYGTMTHAELADACVAWGRGLGLAVEVRQTNHEGEMLDWLNAAADDAVPVVLNAGAWTHYSWAIRDACAQLVAPLRILRNGVARAHFRFGKFPLVGLRPRQPVEREGAVHLARERQPQLGLGSLVAPLEEQDLPALQPFLCFLHHNHTARTLRR